MSTFTSKVTKKMFFFRLSLSYGLKMSLNRKILITLCEIYTFLKHGFTGYFCTLCRSVSEFNEFEPLLKSEKNPVSIERWLKS